MSSTGRWCHAGSGRAARNLMGTGLSHFRGFVAESFRDEGRVEGRGVAVPDEARQRISSCTDLAVLDVWFERAVTAATAEAVLDGG
ncbi:hypothetical protein ABZ741_21155 [Streptomyces globisporus]|uniref:hypothetical protein n=2 Tax=Streptomyces TaxID=1883 RepID=UPI00345FD628